MYTNLYFSLACSQLPISSFNFKADDTLVPTVFYFDKKYIPSYV